MKAVVLALGTSRIHCDRRGIHDVRATVFIYSDKRCDVKIDRCLCAMRSSVKYTNTTYLLLELNSIAI